MPSNSSDDAENLKLALGFGTIDGYERRAFQLHGLHMSVSNLGNNNTLEEL
jgi:hypothetical protein